MYGIAQDDPIGAEALRYALHLSSLRDIIALSILLTVYKCQVTLSARRQDKEMIFHGLHVGILHSWC